MLFRQVVFLSGLCVATAQNFFVPPGWRKPTSNLSREERANISSALINTVVPLFNANSGYIDALGHTQTANLLCAIALHDFISGNKSNEAVVTDHLITVGQILPDYYIPRLRLNTDPLNWALAAAYAYRAYGDQYLLDLASSLWNQTNQYMVTPADAANGSHPLRSSSFSRECNGATVAGGVFWNVDNNADTGVNGATIGSFMTLSAHLFEATNDTRYATAAELSAEFIRSHLYNGTIILDSISLADCTTSNFLITYNSGFYIEGLSVWANVLNNSTWVNFLNTLIPTTIPFPSWTETDGINIEEPGSANDALTNGFGVALKVILIRGLYEAWSRSSVDSAVAKLIQSYILVQYNSLLDLASIPDSNQYSPRWRGRPVDHLLPWGQLAALDVLNSALGMAPVRSSETPSSSPIPTSPMGSMVPSPSPTGSTPATSKTKTGLIAGVSVGGVGLLLILALMIGYFLRRRQRRERARRDSQFNPRPYPSQTTPSIQQSTSCPMSQALPSSQLSSSLPTLGACERPHPSRSGISATTLNDPPLRRSSSLHVKHDMSISQPGNSTATSMPLESSELQTREPGSAATRDARAALPAVPLQSAQPTVDRREAAENNIIDAEDPAMLPDLIQRMNRIIARLPARDVVVEEEAPPRYES